jgi:heat shock protein HtpX
MTASLKVPRYPVWPTVIFLTVSAWIGFAIGVFVLFISAETLAWAGGPIGWLLLFPLIAVSAGATLTYLLLATPLWAIIGGAFFAGLNSGEGGSLARLFGVTFFSDEHPINIATQEMAKRLGLPPVPYVGWYDADDINAFAAGTIARNALVAVSRGVVEKLSKEQLDAVIGHELGHVASNDMSRMQYAQGVQGALTFFLIFRGLKKVARWMFTPLSELELLRFSRKREFTADAVGARLTSAKAMISALEAIRDQEAPVITRDRAFLMLYAGFSSGSLFSTHPPLENRIAALRRLATGQSAEHVSGAA